MKRVPMPEWFREQAKVERDPLLGVPCQHCGARAGDRCVLRSSGRLLSVAHPSRREEAARGAVGPVSVPVGDVDVPGVRRAF